MKKDNLKLALKIMTEKGIPLTKINIQKIVFFLKYSNMPIGYHFEPYLYGPYSFELQTELDDMVLWGEIKKNGKNYDISDTNIDDDVSNKTLKEGMEERIEQFIDAVNQNYSFEKMELAGTVIYCINALESIDLDTSKDSVIEEFKKWKHEKYSDKEIGDMYDKLAHLIKKN